MEFASKDIIKNIKETLDFDKQSKVNKPER
jgi:hypothetical protein